MILKILAVSVGYCLILLNWINKRRGLQSNGFQSCWLLIHAIMYTSIHSVRVHHSALAHVRARVYEISNSISAWFRLSKIITFKRDLFVYASAIPRTFRNFRRANPNLILASVAIHIERGIPLISVSIPHTVYEISPTIRMCKMTICTIFRRCSAKSLMRSYALIALLWLRAAAEIQRISQINNLRAPRSLLYRGLNPRFSWFGAINALACINITSSENARWV